MLSLQFLKLWLLFLVTTTNKANKSRSMVVIQQLTETIEIRGLMAETVMVVKAVIAVGEETIREDQVGEVEKSLNIKVVMVVIVKVVTITSNSSILTTKETWATKALPTTKNLLGVASCPRQAAATTKHPIRRRAVSR